MAFLNRFGNVTNCEIDRPRTLISRLGSEKSLVGGHR
jgi:hypothetical protein